MFLSHRLATTTGLTWRSALVLALVALVVTQAMLFVYPTGFAGGPTDDQRYLEATLDWLRVGPHAGATHWSLRHPLILSIVAVFTLLKPSVDAILLVPRLYYGLFVLSSVTGIARVAGRRAALIWTALAATQPLFHDMATSCFPEMLELAFGAVSLWSYLAVATATTPRQRVAWAALAGVALGLAILTRETAVSLLPVLAWITWRDSRISGTMLVATGVAALLPLVADTLWLYALSGELLWRVHVDQRHTLIGSDHLMGHVYRGRVFMNPDLAWRWRPSGPTRIHWSINPLGDFLIDPNFGLAIAAWGVASLRWFRGSPPSQTDKHTQRLLWLVALASYLTVTWLFTLRPQPRYYMFVVAAAITGLAFYTDAAFDRAQYRRRAIGLLSAVMLVGTTMILIGKDGGWAGTLASDYVLTHPGQYSADLFLTGRSWWRLNLKGQDARLTTRAPDIGQYQLRQIGANQLSGGRTPPIMPGFRPVALLVRPEPWLVRLARPQFRRAILVEQRVR